MRHTRTAPYIEVTLSGTVHRIHSLYSLQDISIQRMKYILPEIVVLVYKPIHEPHHGLHSHSKPNLVYITNSTTMSHLRNQSNNTVLNKIQSLFTMFRWNLLGLACCPLNKNPS
jgi:hypothetical protein